MVNRKCGCKKYEGWSGVQVPSQPALLGSLAGVEAGCRPVPRCPLGLSLGVNEPKEMALQEVGADEQAGDLMSL